MESLLIALEQFHFLRPYWLLALPFGFLIGWLWRRVESRSDWQEFIEPVLLDALLTRPEVKSRLTPALMVNLLTLCWILALAGPSWQREPSPLVDDTAPLVVGLYLGESMLQEDLKPSRLVHAKQKITRLLALRRGAPTALMVYAGSSHTVLPLTEDIDVLELYLEDLEPSVAPRVGNRPDLLLDKASALLGDSGGSIILVGDNLNDFIAPGAEWNPVAGRVSVNFLSIQAPFLEDESSLSRSLSKANIEYVTWSVDGQDIETLIDSIDRRWQHQLKNRDDIQWQDAGQYFLWPLMLLMALFYRRGMVLQWS